MRPALPLLALLLCGCAPTTAQTVIRDAEIAAIIGDGVARIVCASLKADADRARCNAIAEESAALVKVGLDAARTQADADAAAEAARSDAGAP